MAFLRGLIVLAGTLAAVTASAAQLYWLDEGGIHRVNLDGSNRELILPVQQSEIRGFAADGSTNSLYWVEPEQLGRSNLDGSNPQTMATILYGEGGIAVHPITHEVWWNGALAGDLGGVLRTSPDGATTTHVMHVANGEKQFFLNPAGDQLYSLNTEDSGITRYIGSGNSKFIANYAYAMAVDLPGGKVYFDQINELNTIYRANLDGSNVETAFNPAVPHWAGALAIDSSSQTLYMGSIFPSDIFQTGIYRVNVDGTGLQPIATATGRIFQLLIVPEPTSLAMMIAALPVGYLAYRKRRVSAN